MLGRDARMHVATQARADDGVFSTWKGAIIVAPPGTGKTTFIKGLGTTVKAYDGDTLLTKEASWPMSERLDDDEQLRDAYAYASVFLAAATVTKEKAVVFTYPPPLVWPARVRPWLYVVQPDASVLKEHRSARDGYDDTSDIKFYDKVGPRHYTTLKDAWEAAKAALNA